MFPLILIILFSQERERSRLILSRAIAKQMDILKREYVQRTIHRAWYHPIKFTCFSKRPPAGNISAIDKRSMPSRGRERERELDKINKANSFTERLEPSGASINRINSARAIHRYTRRPIELYIPGVNFQVPWGNRLRTRFAWRALKFAPVDSARRAYLERKKVAGAKLLTNRISRLVQTRRVREQLVINARQKWDLQK